MEPKIINASGIMKLNTIKPIANTHVVGWTARERFNPEGKPISLEMGIYVNDKMFIGIPIHFQLKDKLNKHVMRDGIQYYNVPTDLVVGVDQLTYKSGVTTPILVKPSEKFPPMFITTFAYAPENGVILDAKLDDHTKVLRKVIDVNRKYIAFLLVSTYPMNDALTTVEIDEGIIDPPNESDYYKRVFKFTPIGFNSDTYIEKQVIEGTNFISAANYIDVPRTPRADAGKPATESTPKLFAPRGEQSERSEHKTGYNKKPYSKSDNDRRGYNNKFDKRS